jgi:miniconductance mechanosensitive channel
MLDNVFEWFEKYPNLFSASKFFLVLIGALIVYAITKYILFNNINKFVKKTKTKYDEILISDKILTRIAYIAPLIIIHSFAYVLPDFEEAIYRITESMIVLFILLAAGTFLSSLTDILQSTETFKDRPIKGYIQVIKIVFYILGGIIVIGFIAGREPWQMLGGVGALTAVILLVFKDTILSFVASIQITSYDLVKVGDWIEVPTFNADGDVIDISLNVIKIQNFDKTISVIPTYKLIDSSFKNWRGMKNTGGRRIKRSIHIDMATIKFCTEEMLKRFTKFELFSDYIDEKINEVKNYNESKKINIEELVNGRRLTNIGTFRAYLKAYLKQREDISDNLTFLVRQLEPKPDGIPIQIYVFAKTTAWVQYEEIQADIFDHILAIVPQFDLKIYQNPSGEDFKSLSYKAN